MHLTAINAHVADSLEQQRGAAALWLPRCEGGAPGGAGAAGRVGVSGFAFQGTNAHLIVARQASGGRAFCVQAQWGSLCCRDSAAPRRWETCTWLKQPLL